MAQRHLITSALPYANGPLHIGHVVGCFLPSDMYNRYLRSEGQEVLFVCGTDENGVPITLKARKEGISPQQVVDENHALIKDSLEEFGIVFDRFSRTSTPLHHETAQEFFLNLHKKGRFIEQETDQLYDPEAGLFLADRYITGTCPNCGHDAAYGDQCESCGKSLSPNELINPRSTLSGAEPVLRKTTNWYLPLDQLQAEFLDDFIESKKGIWRNTVYGQSKSWLKEGLRPRAMTRDLDWGVPVPIEGVENKVLYVWFDAPIGYITATKEAVGDDWEKWWKDEGTELTHFLGKDNIVFHCLIFPSMLHAHGDYILPTHVPANEFLNLENDKISTSRNHAIWLHEYLKDFPGKQDELRYTLTSIMPETKDADFTWKDFQARVNNELVAIFGNFVNRVLVLSKKYYDSVVPTSEEDASFMSEIDAAEQRIHQAMKGFRMREANEAFMDLARSGNRYLQEQAPWLKVKEEGTEAEVAQCLYTCLQLVRRLADWSGIFLPFTASKLNGLLNLKEGQSLASGHQMNKPDLIFTRIEDEQIEEQLKKLEKEEAPADNNYRPIKDMIEYDDFAKLDIRVGTITAADKVEKADRLLKLEVDLGSEKRTVVSGIAEQYSPEEVIGKQVSLLVNLAPRKLRGIESQGMILMAEDAEGNLSFVSPDKATSPGSEIR